jgi:hypothetical protein
MVIIKLEATPANRRVMLPVTFAFKTILIKKQRDLRGIHSGPAENTDIITAKGMGNRFRFFTGIQERKKNQYDHCLFHW